jgi:hypothetical protein
MHLVRKILLAALAAAATVVLVSGCGATDVTKSRVEAALAPTFANLYVRQAALLGHQNVSITSTNATATCDRGGPKVADEGPGADWICMVHFTDEAGNQQDGKFELQIKSNSCYMAGGPSKLIGLATITDVRGNDVVNPVFEFDGCFNPNG